VAVTPSRGNAGISAEAGESRDAIGRVDGATVAEARVARREGRSMVEDIDDIPRVASKVIRRTEALGHGGTVRIRRLTILI